MDKVTVDNRTESMVMSELLILASKIDIEDEDFESIMGVRFNLGVNCTVKRNKESITMIFTEGE